MDEPTIDAGSGAYSPPEQQAPVSDSAADTLTGGPAVPDEGSQQSEASSVQSGEQDSPGVIPSSVTLPGADRPKAVMRGANVPQGGVPGVTGSRAQEPGGPDAPHGWEDALGEQREGYEAAGHVGTRPEPDPPRAPIEHSESQKAGRELGLDKTEARGLTQEATE